MAPASQSDEQLLKAFLDGDDAALGTLADRHERDLLGLARGLLGGDATLACDAVQDAWVRVIRHGHGFSDRSSFRTWIYRIVVNRCRDLRAGRSRTRSRDGAAGGHDANLPVDDDRLAELRGAVERLTDVQREIVVLCYHQGMTHDVAAGVLEIPSGTVKSRLNAALTALRDALCAEKAI